MTAYRCAACGQKRSPGALVRVTDVKSGDVRYVCRVSYPPEGIAAGWCFRAGVRLRDADRIEAA